MASFCPTPGCTATYDTDNRPIGTRFPCRSCGALLEMRRDGLFPVTPPSPERAGATTALAASQPFPVGDSGGLGSHLISMLASLVFGAGAAMTLYFLFAPRLDEMQLLRSQAEINEGDRTLRRFESSEADKFNDEIEKEREALSEKLKDAREAKDVAKEKEIFAEMMKLETDITKRRAAMQKKIKAKQKEWRNRKASLDEKCDTEEATQRKSLLGYTRGVTFGLILLALGAVAFLGSGMGPARRVVGAVVLCLLVFMVFLRYLFPIWGLLRDR